MPLLFWTEVTSKRTMLRKEWWRRFSFYQSSIDRLAAKQRGVYTTPVVQVQWTGNWNILSRIAMRYEIYREGWRKCHPDMGLNRFSCSPQERTDQYPPSTVGHYKAIKRCPYHTHTHARSHMSTLTNFHQTSWSSGRNLWLLIMRSRVRFPVLPWEFSLKGRIPAVTMVWVG